MSEVEDLWKEVIEYVRESDVNDWEVLVDTLYESGAQWTIFKDKLLEFSLYCGELKVTMYVEGKLSRAALAPEEEMYEEVLEEFRHLEGRIANKKKEEAIEKEKENVRRMLSVFKDRKIRAKYNF